MWLFIPFPAEDRTIVAWSGENISRAEKHDFQENTIEGSTQKKDKTSSKYIAKRGNLFNTSFWLVFTTYLDGGKRSLQISVYVVTPFAHIESWWGDDLKATVGEETWNSLPFFFPKGYNHINKLDG